HHTPDSYTLSLHDALPIYISEQLDKYGKYKTLDPKILRIAEMNSLTNGKFYDYAVGYYNFIDIEPELHELIDSHFIAFWGLSKRSEEHTSELQSRENLVCR